jgi:site-specific recombinase XerC
VPRRLIAPFSDPELRSLLALADDRERALALVFLDTGLRLSELASLRVGDVRPDGTLHVMGKGAKERIVPIGSTARRGLVRYLATRESVGPADPLFTSRRRTGLTARGVQQAIAKLGRRAGSAPAAARTRSVTPSRAATSSTGATSSAFSRSWVTRRSKWSAAM